MSSKIRHGLMLVKKFFSTKIFVFFFKVCFFYIYIFGSKVYWKSYNLLWEIWNPLQSIFLDSLLSEHDWNKGFDKVTASRKAEDVRLSLIEIKKFWELV